MSLRPGIATEVAPCDSQNPRASRAAVSVDNQPQNRLVGDRVRRADIDGDQGKHQEVQGRDFGLT